MGQFLPIFVSFLPRFRWFSTILKNLLIKFYKLNWFDMKYWILSIRNYFYNFWNLLCKFEIFIQALRIHDLKFSLRDKNVWKSIHKMHFINILSNRVVETFSPWIFFLYVDTQLCFVKILNIWDQKGFAYSYLGILFPI